MPTYEDAEEFDIFIHSGLDDLGPRLIENPGEWTRNWQRRTTNRNP
jgi:hypothetical protein